MTAMGSMSGAQPDGTPADEQLPEYDNPPVAEVVLATAFERLPGLRIMATAALRDEFGHRFATVEEQGPVAVQFERFGVPGAGPSVSLEALDAPPLPRVWFLTEDKTKLIQVQQDWFAANWRRQPDGGEYPHYEELVQWFEEDLSIFAGFVQARDLGTFKPTQCEVTYINHIPVEDAATSPGELDAVLDVLTRSSHDDFLPTPESVRVNLQYVIDHEGSPAGRLYVTGQPAFRREGRQPIFLVTLTARGAPLSEGVDGVLGFMDVAHRWIVKGFTNLTRVEMHELWGRTDGR